MACSKSDDFLKDMAGGYMGPVWHLEKTHMGGKTFSIACVAKCKDKECAEKLVEHHKDHGIKQMSAEQNALRYTVMPALSEAPGADDCTIRWIEQWTDSAAHEAHKSKPHTLAFKENCMPLMESIKIMEFDSTNHLEKPKLEWKKDYGLFATLASKDPAESLKLITDSAPIQVDVEPGATRFTVFGQPEEKPSKGFPPNKVERHMCFWLAQWCERKNVAEHNEFDFRKELGPKLMASGLTGDHMKDYAGGYLGPVWHAEKTWYSG